ncbi:MAG TPA: DUF58 domain-containing protein [Polyangia bacterium]|jgi:uncharacterized protein (DUF58 family)|nr:DUF58 domain-containing protein [Polyangia bacterium]
MELLDPLALARLQNLELRARTVVEGALSGLHRSPHHGSSVEFAEHKEYAPGDEIKHIDWKAYGKFDKYYVKRFEEETELRAYMVLDCSASMGYRGAGVSKLDYARMLSAALAYLLLRQQDQVGMVAFSEKLRGFLPPRSRGGHLGDLLTALDGVVAEGRTDLGRAIAYVSEVAQRRSLILVFSDLLGSDDRVRSLLRGLRARKHDVAVFHLLDRDELTLPFEGTTVFESMEDDDKLIADPGDVRRAYLAELGRFIEGYRSGLAEGDVEYHLIDTSTPPSQALLQFLTGAWRTRGRRR